jgi:hypothetical protein
MHISQFYAGRVPEILLTAGCCDLQSVEVEREWLCKGSWTAGQPDSQTVGQSDGLSRTQTFWTRLGSGGISFLYEAFQGCDLASHTTRLGSGGISFLYEAFQGCDLASHTTRLGSGSIVFL